MVTTHLRLVPLFAAGVLMVVVLFATRGYGPRRPWAVAATIVAGFAGYALHLLISAVTGGGLCLATLVVGSSLSTLSFFALAVTPLLLVHRAVGAAPDLGVPAARRPPRRQGVGTGDRGRPGGRRAGAGLAPEPVAQSRGPGRCRRAGGADLRAAGYPARDRRVRSGRLRVGRSRLHGARRMRAALHPAVRTQRTHVRAARAARRGRGRARGRSCRHGRWASPRRW